ncbi:MAG: ATP-sensitive inward rectifier potassium channel 10 [Deltaproteobacteria bacterium]|nr:ATP-sensitive inward rectifier potassium channel 10 [Deltaproteobacteria bacterium]
MSAPPKARPARTMNPNGTVNVVRLGLKRRVSQDLYHVFRTTTWPRLLGVVAAAWLLANLAFAALFYLGGDCIAGAEPGSFGDAFAFSVQTLATIGYGAMSPKTGYAHALVAVEAFLGLLFTAMTTGVVFAKFATPTARIMFARHPLITDFDGERVFMFRIANERSNNVVEASVTVSFIKDQVTKDGTFLRRFTELPLKRSATPLFVLGWTVFHVIDEASPLYGLGEAELAALNATFLVVFTGTDDSLAATVHARHGYDWSDVRFEHRYADLITQGEGGRPRVMDFARFHDTLPKRAPEEGS